MSAVADLSCREFVERVTDYLENSLPEPLHRRIEEHLAVCTGCTLYLGQIRLTIRALHEHRSVELPAELRTALIRQFRQAADDDGG
jgi:hypothetical protein